MKKNTFDALNELEISAWYQPGSQILNNDEASLSVKNEKGYFF